ncbi:MAG: hypothetical protein IJX19_07805 [Clostridia bacterium]|nr:hypothetical protein [Clostridia bacterium]
MRATNLTELIWDGEIAGLLRMCGEDEIFVGNESSDYQRFLAICRSAHLLQGHPFLHRLSCFLREVLKISLFLSIENAEVIWRLGACRLLERAVSREDWKDFSAKPQEEVALPMPFSLDAGRFFKGNDLLNTNAISWDAWKVELQTFCHDAFEKGSAGVLLVLPKDFCFVSPNPYRIGLSLQKEVNNQSDESILPAQLVRFLAEACLKKKKSLLLRVEGDPSQAVKQLSYTETKVGLPSLIWNVVPQADPEPLLQWSAVEHQTFVGCALFRQDYENDFQWNQALRGYAKRYPIGRLQVVE